MENESVAVDAVSILRTINRLSELALKDLEHYRDTLDVSRMQSAANHLREMEEFIDGYKLPFMIAAFEHAATGIPKTGEV